LYSYSMPFSANAIRTRHEQELLKYEYRTGFAITRLTSARSCKNLLIESHHFTGQRNSIQYTCSKEKRRFQEYKLSKIFCTAICFITLSSMCPLQSNVFQDALSN
jgi:hypothetical protein